MAKVTGLGGIFYKVADPAATQAWYKETLGIGGEWGAMFPFKKDDPEGFTLLSPFKADSDYFGPSDKPFMVNLRVDDLDGVIADLKARGSRSSAGRTRIMAASPGSSIPTGSRSSCGSNWARRPSKVQVRMSAFDPLRGCADAIQTRASMHRTGLPGKTGETSPCPGVFLRLIAACSNAGVAWDRAKALARSQNTLTRESHFNPFGTSAAWSSGRRARRISAKPDAALRRNARNHSGSRGVGADRQPAAEFRQARTHSR